MGLVWQTEYVESKCYLLDIGQYFLTDWLGVVDGRIS
jgi:hypothetical protein